MIPLTRRLHRLHRALGTLLCVLLLTWFASGAVMTFAAFPSYSARERLHDLPALPKGLAPELPARLVTWLAAGGLGSGELRLVASAGTPRWVAYGTSTPQLAAARAPFELPALSRAAARARAERVMGLNAQRVELLQEPDQWTVPLGASAFPLWHTTFADARGTQLYLSQASGEIVQRTWRSERVLAWLGPIPHWIYLTALRRHGALWTYTVITLASVGLVLTLSGLWIGAAIQRQLAKPARAQGLRDAYLRWHQRIGLGFGALVASWLLSGILSFTPFAWTKAQGAWEMAEERLGGGFARSAVERVGAALAACQRTQDVVQLALRSLADVPLAVCTSRRGLSQLVRLDRPDAIPQAQLGEDLKAHLRERVEMVAPVEGAAVLDVPDLYYYPTHANPEVELPVLRVQLADRQHIALYIDARTGALAALHTDRTRLERWLFHGLHSWDYPALYRQLGPWRAGMWLAMLCGATLSGLGLLMTLRRGLRARRQG